jgi:6-phosphogluconolactonase
MPHLRSAAARGGRRPMTAPERIVVTETSRLAEAAAAWIAAALEADVRHHGRSALALAGGATPRPVYECLARDPLAARIAWGDLDIFFGDERAVPPDDPASNYGMAAATLLGRVPVAAARIHRMEAERPDRDAAAREYERLLPARLDILLLGMGPDGHTASLFPGSAALDQRERLVVPVTGPKPPAERLTITPPVIAAARRVAVMASGAEKAAAVARALQGPERPRETPVQWARRGVWFLDQAAAAHLRSVAA